MEASSTAQQSLRCVTMEEGKTFCKCAEGWACEFSKTEASKVGKPFSNCGNSCTCITLICCFDQIWNANGLRAELFGKAVLAVFKNGGMICSGCRVLFGGLHLLWWHRAISWYGLQIAWLVWLVCCWFVASDMVRGTYTDSLANTLSSSYCLVLRRSIIRSFSKHLIIQGCCSSRQCGLIVFSACSVLVLGRAAEVSYLVFVHGNAVMPYLSGFSGFICLVCFVCWDASAGQASNQQKTLESSTESKVFIKCGEGWTCTIAKTKGPDAGATFLQCGEGCTCLIDETNAVKLASA
ncbi:hypothetical protein TEA_018743 [Camellia sinensis var. sinensis]|uniref:Uncharacterized protein n=1 Tax=Camellia sinensis var. sinensis TaxID=542762 RepID=A0A4S4E8H5_CAMSN|nr:hypothetical protein TEA_018743 [Camellia sinensis var. sinensis]